MLASVADLASAAPASGEHAPALIAPELDGTRFDLAQLRGKVVIVNFWATWCEPCREEMPALDAFYTKYRDRGLALIGISVDRSRDRADVVKAMQVLHYPAAILSQAENDGFGKPTALPVTYIIDGGGVVRAVLTPDKYPITEQSLATVVRPLLASGHTD
jgi:thiol-disulfide isomerase/thioredoxin